MTATIRPTGYQPTTRDRLWLLRAVEAEGPVRRQVAQALVNRFTFLGDTYPTLADFVRAYAQPVNPRWHPGGDKYRAAMARAETDEQKRKLRAQAQRRLAASTRTAFRDETKEAVDRALTRGPVDLPSPDVTDYGASWLDSSSYLEARTGARPGVNRLWSARPGWPGYRVKVHPGVVAPGEDSAPLLLALGLVIIAVSAAARG